MGLACDFFRVLPLGSWALHVPFVLMIHAVSLCLLPTSGPSHVGLNTRWNKTTQCLLRNKHVLVGGHINSLPRGF